MTSWGLTTLPRDVDIFFPSPSTMNPWVRTCSYGGFPYMPTDVRREDWNHHLCWSLPSRYISAGHFRSGRT